MQTYYQPYLEKSPQGPMFRARTPNAVITAYKSGKVLFQGANPTDEIVKWTNEKSVNNQLKTSHIGSDESGTGDFFGPVTAAAVFITQEQIVNLKELGIQDSKLIKDDSILNLSKKIVEMNIPYSLLVLNNEKYNQ